MNEFKTGKSRIKAKEVFLTLELVRTTFDTSFLDGVAQENSSVLLYSIFNSAVLKKYVGGLH